MCRFRVFLVCLIAVLLMAMSVAVAQTAGNAPTTGIRIKKPVFGAACKICPWGALG